MTEYTVGTALKWLVTDHLGSTRVELDGAGNVAKRYDYLPFGEQLYAGVRQSGGNGQYGYEPPMSGTRQRFGSKERDNETGLDYFLARYYSNIQGRFTSVDPESAGSDPEDPQSWNSYGYARNNPVLLTDPDGRKYKVCHSGESVDYSDEDFWRIQRAGRKDGYSFTGDGDFFESGAINDSSGHTVATYQQTSIDSNAGQLVYEMRRQSNDPKLIMRAAVNVIIGAIISNSGPSGPKRSSSGSGGLTLGEMIGTLRQAAKTKGNFGMGKATRAEAQVMGEAWVGPGARVASDGKTLISADGLKVYRPPSNKPRLGKEQANFEWRTSPGGPPVGNGHLDIQ